MPIFTWDPSYSVGFNEFDDHHKHLFDLINQLYDAMKVGKGSQELGVVINELLEYTNFHFSSKEARFTQFAYPETRAHKAEHQVFKEKVLDFKNKVAEGQIGLTVRVASFLKDWLVNHIKVEDKKYGPYLKSKGL
jgi:hemerythrin